MIEIKMNVRKATILSGRGPDNISLFVDLPATYPELGYETCITISAREGYGAEWCKKVLGIKAEVIKI